jgi:hypothetical protein
MTRYKLEAFAGLTIAVSGIEPRKPLPSYSPSNSSVRIYTNLINQTPHLYFNLDTNDIDDTSQPKSVRA